MKRIPAWLCLAALTVVNLAGCASRPVQAPVVDRIPPAAASAAAKPAAPAVVDARPEFYTIRRGDTMFSIALDHGLDYKELAAWNNLSDPGRIRPGQQLRVRPPPGVQEAPVTVNPISSAGRVEARPLGAPATVTAEPARGSAAQGVIKSEPLGRKLPYTPENLALLQRGETPIAAPGQASAATPAPAPTAAPVAPAAAAKPDAAADDEDKVDWGRPAQGRIIAAFSEPSNKGVDITGKPGDPVIAAAPGRVIYSGEMRGYGKLAVIKHNKTYSSVYAHNRDILVKEGQSVVKGQKIAELGSTDSDAPKLHFEIRKLGKPVDPAKFLPPT
jgi:lipoprotein NlpD